MTRIMREFPRPRIEVEPTDYGMRVITLRQISDANTHVRVTNLVFPHTFVIPMSSEMTITQWHVPIDDTRHYWYAIFTSFGAPVDKDEMRRQRLELYQLPDYVPRKNKSNDYGFDPHEQAHDTFTGMGADINVHDQWACELMGAIADRTREHLGQSDKAISAYRRMLRAAIEEAGRGGKPPMVLDPAAPQASPAPPRSTASARPKAGKAIGRRPTKRGERHRAGPTAIEQRRLMRLPYLHAISGYFPRMRCRCGPSPRRRGAGVRGSRVPQFSSETPSPYALPEGEGTAAACAWHPPSLRCAMP